MASRNLIFLYVNDGGAQSPDICEYNPHQPTSNHFAHNLPSEGYFCLLKALKDLGVFDNILIFIETTRNPGHLQYEKGIDCHVVPHIRCVDKYLRPGDIIWARGGWRSWHDYLAEKKGKHWLCLYAANSGRSRWKFWDVIFDDLSGKSYADGLGRFYFDFVKPTNESIFRSVPLQTKKKYDICIGASHIHDKKGQWRMVYALDVIKNRYNVNLKCVMPGRFLRGVETGAIPQNVISSGLDVDMPGMISRQDLALLMSQCTVFIYAGESGQNDRGPIEALACGLPISVARMSRHHPLVWDQQFCKNINWKDISKASDVVFNYWQQIRQEGNLVNVLVRNYYDEHMSLKRITDRMGMFFYMLQDKKVGSKL